MNNLIRTALFSALMLIVLPSYGIIPSYGQTCNTAVIESTPISQFTLNTLGTDDAITDGTATDNKTGLTWMRCSLGQVWNSSDSSCTGTASSYTWQQALAAANDVEFASLTDWRLPNIKELKSITEQACYNPAINISVFPNALSYTIIVSVFPNTLSSFYWSSSPIADSSGLAWNVNFGNGYGDGGSKSDGDYVRLVRGGQ